MKEQFVTYEIALKLKEFGFREECLAIYGVDRKELIIMDNAMDIFRETLRIGQTLRAPLWQQAWQFVLDKLSEYYPIIVFEKIENRLWCVNSDRNELICEDSQEQAILKVIELMEEKTNESN